MYLFDKDKMTFMVEGASYLYNVMPFGLKNMGTTYQCLFYKVFKDLIGNIMEVYVNDMVIKSTSR